MTAQETKVKLKTGAWVMEPGFPHVRHTLSDFQQDRTRQAFKVAQWYFQRGLTVNQIAARLGVTHQRVTQILRLAVKRMIEVGHLHQATPPDAVPSNRHE